MKKKTYPQPTHQRPNKRQKQTAIENQGQGPGRQQFSTCNGKGQQPVTHSDGHQNRKVKDFGTTMRSCRWGPSRRRQPRRDHGPNNNTCIESIKRSPSAIREVKQPPRVSRSETASVEQWIQGANARHLSICLNPEVGSRCTNATKDRVDLPLLEIAKENHDKGSPTKNSTR
jgi:hypothetical protein